MTKNLIAFVPALLSDEVVFFQPTNFPKTQNLYVSAVYSPKIRFWDPSLELNLSKNFYKLGNPLLTYNKPVLFTTLKNSFLFPKDFSVIVTCTYNTRGYNGIDYTYDFFCTDIYLSKLVFNKKLRINIGAENIFNTEKQKSFLIMNCIETHKWKDANTRNINISISYNFNTARSKYKGEQASDELNRL
jgi:hypothetical protein